jgi:hypothetical protein
MMEVVLSKKQAKYIVEKSGEKTLKKAFRMWLLAMSKEKISADKMPLLIDKMMAKDQVGKKE